jgi:hypothetical protein
MGKRRTAEQIGRLLREAQRFSTAGEGSAATTGSIERTSASPHRQDSTLPYKYQREPQRLKFLASQSLDRVVCADVESYRAQQGLAAQGCSLHWPIGLHIGPSSAFASGPLER